MTHDKARPQMLQLRLSVNDIMPEIWRTFQVSSDATLAKLHTILQVLMGWKNKHLYVFAIDGKRYSPPDEDERGRNNAIQMKLSNVFKGDSSVIGYEYDFGDNWTIKLCNELADHPFPQSDATVCIAGSRHGPVEDSGGAKGYSEMTRIYCNPHHKRHKEVLAFLGPTFDAEAFDQEQINKMLKAIG